MSSIAQYVDGVLQTSKTTTTKTTTSSTSNTSLDKDAFLQLLVAQMKYQDPLEPTSNTEYIAQLASFSELEEMQNLSSGMDLQRASALVGQEVIMKTTSSTGTESFVSGKVDYVVVENGKAFLSINETLYSIDDLDTVCDEEYLAAYKAATTLVESLAKLPTVANTTLSNADAINGILKTYDAMSTYEKSFVATEKQTLIESYRTRLAELQKATTV